MRGQAAIMDALLFMLVASGAASLLIYVAGLYGSSTNQQITAIYNFEFTGNALVALHYAQDNNGNWFWNELKTKLGSYTDVKNYLDVTAKNVWGSLISASPAKYVFLCFEGLGCYPENYGYVDATPMDDSYFQTQKRTAYAASVNLYDGSNSWTVTLKLYY